MASDTIIDFARLRADIISATVTAINATLFIGEDRARQDVPVRKVFRGGRQSVRFKTAQEIEQDKDLRSRLGLAPEILATPAAIAKVKAAGRNPNKSLLVRSPIRGLTNLETGGAVGRDDEFGFARTIERPSRDPRRLTAGVNRSGFPGADIIDPRDLTRYLQRHGPGQTRGERGLTRNSRNRANTFFPGGVDLRRTEPDLVGGGHQLQDEAAEARLTSRGRYELKSGRAVRGASKVVVDLGTGRIFAKQTEHERLGGGLRSTIRVIRADPSMYPVIEGWLIAGDREHDYAKYQELGTRHNPAHPFLRPRLPEWKEELPVQLRRSYGRTGR